MMKHRILTILTALLLVPFFCSADVEGTISVTPEYPAPYSEAVLTFSSYSFDANVAMITWSVNKKVVLSGLGAKRLAVTMGGAGQSAQVDVTAKLADGNSVSSSITLAPQSVDLLFEGTESHVPPFYGGLALPGEGSATRVVALPTLSENGVIVPSSALSYNWYMNDEFIGRVSGTGKSSASFLLDYLSDATTIKVVVRSPRGNVAEKSISIAPHRPLPTFYAYNEALGTDYSRAFLRRIELDKDVTLSLEPYFLSTRQGTGDYATYAWYLDGLPVTPQEQTLLSLKPKANAYGTRTLSVLLSNSKRKLQEAREELEVIFDTR